MMQEANSSIVRVEIFDQAFSLRGDPDYILKLAQYVDSKIRAIAETHTVDNFSLAVLAALRIANEYHLLKAKLEGEESWKPSPKSFTEEDRQRTRERRERHHTKLSGSTKNSFWRSLMANST